MKTTFDCTVCSVQIGFLIALYCSYYWWHEGIHQNHNRGTWGRWWF